MADILTTLMYFMPLVAGGMALYFFKFRNRNIRKFNVLIFAEREKGFKILRDKAKEVRKMTKDKIEIYHQLIKRKTKYNPPADKSMFRGKRDTILLYSPSPDEYYPCSINIKNPDGNAIITPIAQDQRMWLAHSTRTAYERWQRKSTLDKILPLATVAVTGIVITIMLYIGGRNLITLADASAGYVQAAQTAADGMVKAAQMLVESIRALS